MKRFKNRKKLAIISSMVMFFIALVLVFESCKADNSISDTGSGGGGAPSSPTTQVIPNSEISFSATAVLEV